MAFISLIFSLLLLESVTDPDIRSINLSFTFALNAYFLLFEILQIFIQGLGYLLSVVNLIDFARLFAGFAYLYYTTHPGHEPPGYLLPITLLFMWIKIFSYLAVFKPTRYMIQMISEIINDSKSFMIILFTAMTAYAQVVYTLTPSDQRDIDQAIRQSYVLSLGDLGSFSTIDVLGFFIFVLFSFFIPLVLMNMLIAIMGDSYSRVQENSIAADTRGLGSMLLEMEEVVHFLCRRLFPSLKTDTYYFCFKSMPSDGGAGGDWEGPTAQIKALLSKSE